MVAVAGVAYTVISGAQELWRARSQSNAVASCLKNASPGTTLEIEAGHESRIRLEIGHGAASELDGDADGRAEPAREGSDE
jgi:hypothetical protein